MTNDAAMAPDESMGIKSVDSVVAEIKADTGWCGGREKETREVLMTENPQGTRVGIRDDVAWHERQGKPVENSNHLVLQTPATYVDLGKPKGDPRPQGKNDVRFDLYHKALFEEGPSKSSRVRSAWDEKLGEVKVVDYREARLMGGKLTNLEYIIVYSLNDFAEERKACLAVKEQMNARLLEHLGFKMAGTISDHGASRESPRMPAAPAKAAEVEPTVSHPALVMNRADLDRAYPADAANIEKRRTEKTTGSVVEAQRGSTITVNTLATKTLRLGSGAGTEPGVAKVQITDAPPGVLSRDAVDLVFNEAGNLADVVARTAHNEISVVASDQRPPYQKESITLPMVKGAGIPKEVLARLNLGDQNLEVVIVCGLNRGTVYHLKRSGGGGAEQSFTLK